MIETRPPIPDPVKREVRQRCGFGCVICGLPLYEYDHMTVYSDVHGHEAANLTLLCPDHHSQKTRGLLTEATVRSADASPVNRALGHSRPLELLGDVSSLDVMIGTNRFLSPGGSFVPVMVDGIVLIGVEVEDDQTFLHALFFDEFNLPALQIVRNEVVFSTETWDIEFVGQVLTLRSAPRNIELRLRFDPTGTLTIDRARMYCNGVLLAVTGAEVEAGEQVKMRDCTFQVPIGLLIGWAPPNLPSAAIRMSPSRYRALT